MAIDRRVRSGWPALNAPISLSVSETVGVGTLIHHVSVGTTDIKRARTFYDPLMALIGFRLINARTIRTLWCIGRVETPIDGNPSTAGSGMHIAFQAAEEDRPTRSQSATVDMMRARQESAKNTMRTNNGTFVKDPDKQVLLFYRTLLVLRIIGCLKPLGQIRVEMAHLSSMQSGPSGRPQQTVLGPLAFRNYKR